MFSFKRFARHVQRPSVARLQGLNAVAFVHRKSTLYEVHINEGSGTSSNVYDMWNGKKMVLGKSIFPDKLYDLGGKVLR